MGSLGGSKSVLTDGKSAVAAEATHAPRTRHGTKLRDVLMSDKPNLSYADFHRELTRTPDDPIPRYVGNQQSKVSESKNIKEDELVRYMSNLPSYLEKGKNFQEKALNVGVLDWRRLEKWRHCQKPNPHNHSGYSPSSTNTSFFSSDGSSTRSSRGQSCSPARQRMRRLSLQSPLEASSLQDHVVDAKSSSGRDRSCSPAHQRMGTNVVHSPPRKVTAGGGRAKEIEVFAGSSQKFHDSDVTTGKYLNRHQKVFGTAQLCERKESDMKLVSEMEKRLNSDKYVVPGKGKTKAQGKEFAKETRTLRETKLNAKLNATDRGFSDREKPGSGAMSRDPSEKSSAGLVGSSKLMVNDRLSVEPAEKSLLVRNHGEVPLPSRNGDPKASCSHHEQSAKVSFQAPHTLPHSTKILYNPSTVGAQGVRSSSQATQVPSFPARMFSSPTRNRNTVEKKPVAGFRSATEAKPSEEWDARKSSELLPKARNPSPIRRLSFAMGKMIRGAGSRDNSPLHKPSSRDSVVKSSLDGASSSSSMDNPCSENFPTNNTRGRSSPLRRLLDPLLKPRVSNSSEPSRKHVPLDFHSGHSVEVNMRSASGSSTSVSEAIHTSSNGSSSLQALLQVSFKNGLPLFTFAIDNESNILAATVRKSTNPGKGHISWTYTFFNIREVKRKTGMWLNHGNKGDGHGYVPNVVAQMKVSDSPSFSSTKRENGDDRITREFDLFAVDVGQGDQCPTDFHPTNELAAVVVKLPRFTAGNSEKDDESGYGWLESSQDSSLENLQAARSKSNADSGDDLQSQHSLVSLNTRTTVILPGGVHTVPSKGEISTLAQRWRSGGSCDCGGWDLGCQLKVFTSKKGTERKICSSGTFSNEVKLQLFSQVGQDNQPVFSVAPFKERIYSVEFNSTLSILQAFAVSVSFIDCRRPPELSDTGTIVNKMSTDVGVYDVPVQSKMSKPVEVSGRYVSYPPHSPVGRV